jgi:hypothetical protein
MIALLIVATALVLLCLIPVGARVVYDHTGAKALLLVGPVSVCLYPRPPKAQKAEKKAKKAKKTGSKKQKRDQSSTEPKEKEPLGGKLPLFRQLLSLGLKALGCLRRKLILKNLTVCLTVGGQGEDPAGSGVTYGRAWAAVGALIPVLENTFKIRKRDIRVNIDFTSSETVIYADGSILLRVGDILWIAVFYGIQGLKLFLKHKKKGGKQHGTSNQ